MQGRAAIIVSGTGPNSMGECFVTELRDACPASPIIAVDKRRNPALANICGVTPIILDMNPFTSAHGYDGLATCLRSSIQQVIDDPPIDGIAAIILSAGVYESGLLVDATTSERQHLIGVNVCGKIELLHAALSVNRELGFSNPAGVTLVDIGTLPCAIASSKRSLYSATKAIGLDLCMSMSRGNEVNRAIHLALGPVDTHMLHRNHWVSKEHGCADFFRHVCEQGTGLYRAVFIRCDDAAFAEAVSSGTWDSAKLTWVFEQYKIRRNRQLADSHGVLSVEDVAKCVGAMVADNTSYTSGVYILSAPQGRKHTQYIRFADVMKVGITS